MRRQNTFEKFERNVRTLGEFVAGVGRNVERHVRRIRVPDSLDAVGRAIAAAGERGVRTLKDVAGRAARGHRATWRMLDQARDLKNRR